MTYKFKIGDKLKIIKGGCGMHPQCINRIFTVKEIGKYFGNGPGYMPQENFNTAKEISSTGFAGEESFELYEEAIITPLIFN